MSHDPKLTVYTITIKPHKKVEKSIRWLFRNIINEANNALLQDSFIITEIFKKFIEALDTPTMYSDEKSKKCMTANQPNIEDSNVNPNIILHTNEQIIEGVMEGGGFGRKRSKTSTLDKAIKSPVEEKDAITEDFYFLAYMPLQSNKLILMLQSYSDDTIDSVMKKFWTNFLSIDGVYMRPSINRFVPKRIIDDFKRTSAVSSLSFTTEVPRETLLGNSIVTKTQSYKITVKVTPTEEDLTIDEFEKSIEPIQKTGFSFLNLAGFKKKKGTLKDSNTGNTTPFDLGTSFEIQPSIMLSKYLSLNNDASDFEKIKKFCFDLLSQIKSEIYPQNGVQER
jgi:hypothetical protein